MLTALENLHLYCRCNQLRFVSILIHAAGCMKLILQLVALGVISLGCSVFDLNSRRNNFDIILRPLISLDNLMQCVIQY